MAAGEDSVVHVEPSNTVVQDPPVLVDLQTQVEVVGDFNDTSTQLSSPLERPQFRTDVHSPNSPVIHEPATQGEVSALEQVEIESVAHDEVMALEQVEIEPTIFAHIPNHVHNRHVMYEYNTLLENNTWKLVELPPDRKAIGCK
ncbi:hypothetical protein V6N13_089820 [Hibiscus sabdariffa]